MGPPWGPYPATMAPRPARRALYQKLIKCLNLLRMDPDGPKVLPNVPESPHMPEPQFEKDQKVQKG